MKVFFALCGLVAVISATALDRAQAKVEFVGPNWGYGGTSPEVLQSIGISADPTGETRVTLNLANNRQVKLSGPHASVGLSLVGYQGKCVKIIPGYQFQSVDFILTCD